MSERETLLWRCADCDVTFESDDRRHHMDWCPECGDQYVDHESEYIRRSIGVERVEA